MSRPSTESKPSFRENLADWWRLIALFLFAAACTGWTAWDHDSQQRSAAPPITYTSASRAEPAFEIVDCPIQNVLLGERLVATNPHRDEVDRSFPEPDEATWRLLRLVMDRGEVHELRIELLRPLDWIAGHEAEAGRTIYLDLPELGAEGPADVLALEPCPPIQPGPGQVVTGRFEHRSSHQILNLQIEGEEKPIGVTSNHPIWSESRQEFVPAGRLQVGEELLTLDGTTKVASITLRGPPEPVYNLEVHGEHVFHVAQSGVLVHNACTVPTLEISAKRYPALAENIRHAQRAGHPTVLTHGGNAAANRRAATSGIPSIGGLTRDEYPFASALEGGAGSWIGHVPGLQNSAQGGIISSFLEKFGIVPGQQYGVVIVP